MLKIDVTKMNITKHIHWSVNNTPPM